MVLDDEVKGTGNVSSVKVETNSKPETAAINLPSTTTDMDDDVDKKATTASIYPNIAESIVKIEPSTTTTTTTEESNDQQATIVSCLNPKTAYSSIIKGNTEKLLYVYENVCKSDSINRLEKRLSVSQWDTEAWLAILTESLNLYTSDNKQYIDTTRYYFDCFFRLFPSAGTQWKLYIDVEIKQDNHGLVQKIYQQRLQSMVNVDLWKSYLEYLSQRKSQEADYRDIMIKAYELAIDKIGLDISSTWVWHKYLDFLKGWKTVSTFDEGQKMISLRAVYQKVVVNPIHQFETMWSEYDAYEKSLNQITAIKLLSERQAAYMIARRVYSERKQKVEKLSKTLLAVPPSTKFLSAKLKQQLLLWKSYIDWEKANPLRLNEAELEKRIVFAYDQCLEIFRHYPELWLHYIQYKLFKNKTDDATVIYEKAIAAANNSNLLSFSYADFLEGRNKMPEAKAVYENIIKHSVDPTLAYIHYMKFARRVNGLDEVRSVFRKARCDSKCTYHIFIANALMQYHCGEGIKLAYNLFILGRKKYPDNKKFLMHYLDFLTHINRDNDSQLLFTQILQSIPESQADDVWLKFIQFVSNYFPLQGIKDVEKGLSTKILERGGNRMGILVEKYRYLDLLPCDEMDCDTFSYVPAMNTGEQTLNAKGEPFVFADRDQINTLNNGLYLDKDASNEVDYVMPDLTQFVPFHPESATTQSAEVFAPQKVLELLKILPAKRELEKNINANTVDVIDTQALCMLIKKVDLPMSRMGRRRKGGIVDESDDEKENGDDEDGLRQHRPALDVYRARRRKSFVQRK